MEKGKKVSSDKSSLGRIVADISKEKVKLFKIKCIQKDKDQKTVLESLIDKFLRGNIDV